MAFDQFLKGLSAFDPNGSLSNADADRIWSSYKAAGGGGPVKIVGSDSPGFGGLAGMIQRLGQPSTPAAPAAPQTGPVKFGLPQGGILGLLQGTPPQGLIGMLQRGAGGSPLAGAMPQVGMAPSTAGQPGSPYAGPVNPALPMNINPMDQF